MTTAPINRRLEELLERLGRPTLDYSVSVARWHAGLRERFVESSPDQALCEYLERIAASRASVMRTWAQRWLRQFISDYDANALLGMYEMHLFSTQQAERMLMRPRGGRLLDIGAGCGEITAALASLFSHIEVVEISWAARRRLRTRGYVCHSQDVTRGDLAGGSFDVIALLNVLDRTDRPSALLREVRTMMHEDTQLLMSVPLPYRPHVYFGSSSREPSERLAVVGSSFSDALPRLVHQVLEPSGFRVERVTRLPYLSGGDSVRAVTVLDAAVLVCRRQD